MWLNAGVPSVSTMWSAAAASAVRSDNFSRPLARTRSSSSWVPVSWNGIRPAAIESITERSRSTPITSRPQSANDSASGSPTRPRPTTATDPLMARSLRASAAQALAQELPAERQEEGRVVVEVARQQPARLLRDPVGPLQPVLLHPRRRLRDPPGVEIERGAHGGHHRHAHAVAHLRHPLLLLRHADAHP